MLARQPRSSVKMKPYLGGGGEGGRGGREEAVIGQVRLSRREEMTVLKMMMTLREERDGRVRMGYADDDDGGR